MAGGQRRICPETKNDSQQPPFSATRLQELIKLHGGASIVLCQAEVDLRRRAETLTLEEWARIALSIE